MGKSIVLIGTGNVGSRHLQALARLPYDLTIQAVEPDPQAQSRARALLESTPPGQCDVSVEWLTGLDGIHTCPDLTVVATTSKGRANLIEKLLATGHRRLLIEKVVCQSTDEYDGLLSSVSHHDAKAWVNCIYRYYPYFTEIRDLLEDKGDLCFSAVGSNNGLGCNAIHLLDIVCMLSGTQGISLDGSALHNDIMPCPRGEDFVEFAGLITARTDNGNWASVNFHPGIPPRSLLINILASGVKVFLEDRASVAKAFISREENDWQWEEHDYGDLFLSRLATGIAQSILESDTCDLPSVEDLYQLHDELFRVFCSHLEAVTANRAPICPIT